MVVVSYRNSTSNHNSQQRHNDRVIVVSYRNSTSNHNYPRNICLGIGVVSYRNSTSNHNLDQTFAYLPNVVSYRNSTSNHNHSFQRSPSKSLYLIEILHQTTTVGYALVDHVQLYLIEILHQTTTTSRTSRRLGGCILSKFYIKPQPRTRPESSG